MEFSSKDRRIETISFIRKREKQNCISSEWYLSQHWRYFVKETESACILPVAI